MEGLRVCTEFARRYGPPAHYRRGRRGPRPSTRISQQSGAPVPASGGKRRRLKFLPMPRSENSSDGAASWAASGSTFLSAPGALFPLEVRPADAANHGVSDETFRPLQRPRPPTGSDPLADCAEPLRPRGRRTAGVRGDRGGRSARGGRGIGEDHSFPRLTPRGLSAPTGAPREARRIHPPATPRQGATVCGAL